MYRIPGNADVWLLYRRRAGVVMSTRRTLPIGLIPFILKTPERILHIQLKYIYLKNKSTATALHVVTSYRQNTLATFLDVEVVSYNISIKPLNEARMTFEGWTRGFVQGRGKSIRRCLIFVSVTEVAARSYLRP